MQMPDLPMVIVPQQVYAEGSDEEVRRVADDLYPLVVKSLTD